MLSTQSHYQIALHSMVEVEMEYAIAASLPRALPCTDPDDRKLHALSTKYLAVAVTPASVNVV